MWNWSLYCKCNRAQELRDLALSLCGQWAEPFPTIIASTPLDLISGYPVYDRDPLTQASSEWRLGQSKPTCAVSQQTQGAGTHGGKWTRVTMVGDAAHCMSPLKGQGANQVGLDLFLFVNMWDRRNTTAK